MNEDGFPHAGYPRGWYQMAWAAELEPGDVRPLHYFGRDLVLFRGKSGDFHMLDAFCAHMGAHLGHGGKVSGENIVCPYHGWTWAPDGANVVMPSEKKANEDCRIQAWRIAVANEIVWLWFDEAGREPLWDAPTDLPGVAEGRRHAVYPNCSKAWRNIKMRPQYVAENNVDTEHLRWIHGARGPIPTVEVREDGNCMHTRTRITYGYGKKSTRLTPDGPIEVAVDAEIWGLAFQYTIFPLPDEAVSIQAQTPVDLEHCDMFQTVVVYPEPGSAPADAPQGIADSRVREQLVQIERDIPIWENMRYLAAPALTDAEAGPMQAVRRWAAQFYPAAAK